MKTLLFLTLSIIHFSIIHGQNVGIGITNPSAKLHINGSLKIVNGSQGEGKVLTSDAAGLATWKTPEKSIFKATGFLQTFTVAPTVAKILTDWKNVELNVGANSIFVNAQGDLFVLKNNYYRVTAKVTVWFDDPGDSHSVMLSILINGVKKYSTRCAVPTNDNIADLNRARFSIIVTSIFQLNAQDKISFEFSNDFAANSNTSARFLAGNDECEFIVEQL